MGLPARTHFWHSPDSLSLSLKRNKLQPPHFCMHTPCKKSIAVYMHAWQYTQMECTHRHEPLHYVALWCAHMTHTHVKALTDTSHCECPGEAGPAREEAAMVSHPGNDDVCMCGHTWWCMHVRHQGSGEKRWCKHCKKMHFCTCVFIHTHTHTHTHKYTNKCVLLQKTRCRMTYP